MSSVANRIAELLLFSVVLVGILSLAVAVFPWPQFIRDYAGLGAVVGILLVTWKAL